MTENLRIEGKTISDADSNLPSGVTYTIPASNLSALTTNFNTSAAYVDSTYGGLSIRRLDTVFSYVVRYRDETVSIHPGLYAVLHGDGYEYHWFVETAPYWDVVRNLVRRAEKYCKVYQQGAFQGQVGVFPLTLFILPDDEQKIKLE